MIREDRPGKELKIIMKGGKIMQLASPHEIYNRPRNLYVADFIGSPSMNFLPGRITGRGDGIALDIAGLGSATVAPEQCAEGTIGTDCHVGVRPETMSIRFDGDPTGPGSTAEGTVSEVVYYGDMTYYDIRIAGSEAPATVSMRNTAGRRILTQGETARIGWGRESVVLLN